MSASPRLHALNDGRAMPELGLGVWRTPADEAADVVATAISAGYRLIDTAAIYGNEKGVGEGVRRSQAERDGLFITTKLWNDRQGHDLALKAFDRSLERLGLDAVDLYLIHWPAPRLGLYVETWRALVRLKEEGRARSIGVSNFAEEHLRRIVGETGVTPSVNQIELHPRFQQRALRATHKELGVRTEAWSPLGQGELLTDPVLCEIAGRHGKTPAQVALRWHLDNEIIAIPKSTNAGRIRENFDVFDFALTDADHAAIDALDRADGRIGPDPMLADF